MPVMCARELLRSQLIPSQDESDIRIDRYADKFYRKGTFLVNKNYLFRVKRRQKLNKN
jgi:hypothetical protein